MFVCMLCMLCLGDIVYVSFSATTLCVRVSVCLFLVLRLTCCQLPSAAVVASLQPRLAVVAATFHIDDTCTCTSSSQSEIDAAACFRTCLLAISFRGWHSNTQSF